MVLLPGWATDGRIFDGVLPGVTAVTTGPLRPEGFSRRLAAFLDRTARGPVTVVGWSLGGFLAAEFAREYPDRVRRVVLVGIRREYPEGDLAGGPALALGRPGRLSLGVLRAMLLPVADPRVPHGFAAGCRRRTCGRWTAARSAKGFRTWRARGSPARRFRRAPWRSSMERRMWWRRSPRRKAWRGRAGTRRFTRCRGRRTPPSSRTGFARWSCDG